MTQTSQSLRAPSRASTSSAPSARGVLRVHANGVQEGATPGTVDLLQIRAAADRKARSRRARFIRFFLAKPCPHVEGLPAPAKDSAGTAIVAAAGVVLALAFIFVCGGAV